MRNGLLWAAHLGLCLVFLLMFMGCMLGSLALADSWGFCGWMLLCALACLVLSVRHGRRAELYV